MTPSDDSTPRLLREAFGAVQTGIQRYGSLPTPGSEPPPAFIRDMVHEMIGGPDNTFYLDAIPLPLTTDRHGRIEFLMPGQYHTQIIWLFDKLRGSNPWLRDYQRHIPRRLLEVSLYAHLPTRLLTVASDELITHAWPPLCQVLGFVRSDVHSISLDRMVNDAQPGKLSLQARYVQEV